MVKYLEEKDLNGGSFSVIYEVDDAQIPLGVKVKIYCGSVRIGAKFFKNKKSESFSSIEKSLLSRGCKKMEENN